MNITKIKIALQCGFSIWENGYTVEFEEWE